MEKKCPECTMLVPEESQICPCCGEKFKNHNNQRSTILDTEKKCQYCVMMIPKDAKICPHCRKIQGWTWPAKIFIGLITLGIIGHLMGRNVNVTSKNISTSQTVSRQAQQTPASRTDETLPYDFNPPQGSISAKNLYDVYEANEVASDEKYKGKRLVVYGKIKGIEKNIADQPYISFEAGTLSFVNCRFSKDQINQLVPLQKGKIIAVEGTGAGKMVTTVFLNDCELNIVK